MKFETASALPQHTPGAALVIASSAFFAMAGIFTKSISSDPLTIACWRGLVGGLLITAYVAWRSGRAGLSLAFDWRGWAMVFVAVFASFGFIAAFKYTYVANVAIIYASVPLMAAAMEWFALGVRPRRATLVMALVCLFGVGIIVSGGIGGGHLFGDTIAVGMTLAAALYMVMVRAFRETPVVWGRGSFSLHSFRVRLADRRSASRLGRRRLAHDRFRLHLRICSRVVDGRYPANTRNGSRSARLG